MSLIHFNYNILKLGDSDIVLLKYSTTSAAWVWTRQAGTASYDQGTAVSVSPDSLFVYVVGYCNGKLNSAPYAGRYF